MANIDGVRVVLTAEWLPVSRHWQWYLARSLGVAMLLFALAIVWWARISAGRLHTVQTQAEVGRRFGGAVAATLLAMVLLAAPAATAGSICIDRLRGTLCHVLMTDLTSLEIVLGKLIARLLPVLFIGLSVAPIPALGTLLGGIEPQLVSGTTLVILGVASSGCAAALALSMWGTKTHEVLLVTYGAWALWLLALPMWWGYRQVLGGAPPPAWLERANPVWLVATSYLRPSSSLLRDQVVYFSGSVLASAAFVALAATQLRRLEDRRESGSPAPPRPHSRERARIVDFIVARIPGPSLDGNPVLWREWRRRNSSKWARVVWALYAFVTVGLTISLVIVSWNGAINRRVVASIGNGFQAGIGLLLLAVAAATAFADELAPGNLDVLLATPLETRSILWGKWCGAFRGVPLVVICPALVALALARHTGRYDSAVLVVGIFLAYAAALTSLGLLLATGARRLDLAVSLIVAILGGVTVGSLVAVAILVTGLNGFFIAAASPIVGITGPTLVFKNFSTDEWLRLRLAWTAWACVYLMLAVVLGVLAVQSFDRRLRQRGDTAASS
jgi:ABC-type transport system involved in multi-copper enzyme maturation permease subunit